MLSLIYADCHLQQALYAECCYAECRYAECHGALPLPYGASLMRLFRRTSAAGVGKFIVYSSLILIVSLI
jgi:hypothetical protein